MAHSFQTNLFADAFGRPLDDRRGVQVVLPGDPPQVVCLDCCWFVPSTRALRFHEGPTIPLVSLSATTAGKLLTRFVVAQLMDSMGMGGQAARLSRLDYDSQWIRFHLNLPTCPDYRVDRRMLLEEPDEQS